MREGPLRIIQELEGKEIINGRTGMVIMKDTETDRSIQGTITAEIKTTMIIQDMDVCIKGLIITLMYLIPIAVITTFMGTISITTVRV